MERHFFNSTLCFAHLPNGAYFTIVNSFDHGVYKKWVGHNEDLVSPSTGEIYNAILISPDEEFDENIGLDEDAVTFIDEDQEVHRYDLVRTDYRSWS